VAKFSLNAVLIVSVFAGWQMTAQAEENNPERPRGDYGVTLQPFAAAAAPTPRGHVVRVAYYVPRTTAPLRAEPVEDESPAEPSFLSRDASHPMVPGKYAVVRDGIAYAPSRAPQNVKNAIWAVNTLRRKPYIWGGGHGTFNDYGYDCSGTVSFALHYAGLLATPLPSSDLCHFGERGRGRWITVYSRNGHAFAVIAGLRLDTTDLRYGSDVGPRWYAEPRDASGFDARHPAGW